MKRLFLITGATNGMGWETAKAVASDNHQLVLVARNEEKLKDKVDSLKQLTGNQDIDYIVADLSLCSEIRKAADQFRSRYDKLDVLINNAGAVIPEKKITAEGFEYTFALNHLAYFLLTGLLLDLIPKNQDSRIINISSMAHKMGKLDFDDLFFEKRKYSSIKAYANSKLANILFTIELARRLKDTQTTVNCIHPGGVRTGFGRDYKGLMGLLVRFTFMFMRSPQKGAETCIHLALSPDVKGITGKYWADKKPVNPAPHALNPEDARKLWEISEELTSFKYPV